MLVWQDCQRRHSRAARSARAPTGRAPACRRWTVPTGPPRHRCPALTSAPELRHGASPGLSESVLKMTIGSFGWVGCSTRKFSAVSSASVFALKLEHSMPGEVLSARGTRRPGLDCDTSSAEHSSVRRSVGTHPCGALWEAAQV